MDLGKIPDKQLSKDRRLYVWLLAIKYATREKQQTAIRDLLIEALRSVPEDLYPIVHYLVSAYDYDEQTLRGIIREVRPKEEEKMMSQFARDIEQKVRHKALLEGEAKLLLRQLSHRFQPLPDEISDRVYGADQNTIGVWADRILDAKSLDEVFTE